MGDQNLITGKYLSQPILNILRTGTAMASPLDITSADPPYFFLKIQSEIALRDQKIDSASVSITDWHNVSVGGEESPLDELRFLESLGLAMLRPGSLTSTGEMSYVISPLAISTLYDGSESKGVFINVNENREKKSRAFIKLLLTYVLPGMFWRNYHVTNGLASDLHLTSHLGHEMLEIAELWDRLAAKFGWPIAN